MTASHELQDHLDITRVIQQVARAFDEKLHDDLLPKAFTDDATIVYTLRGRSMDCSMPGGLDTFKYFHDRCYWTQHLVSPHVVAIDGDTARASTPVHAVHLQVRDDGSHNHWVIAAVYQDELVRDGDQWRISNRKAICPYVEGDFLAEGVRVYTELPDLEAVVD